MASKAFLSFSIFAVIQIILLSLLSHNYSVLAHSHAEKKSSPFKFIEHLKGCHKGDKIKGIHELKMYMEKFGYLNYDNYKNQSKHANDDDFDELLESAIKTYQLNYHLKSTGILDANTVAKMAIPRCGVADIVNGTTQMRSGKKRQQHNHHFRTVSHYSFFRGSPRWPASKFSLTYAFRPGTRSDAITPVARAFQTWAANTQFKFSKIEDFANADIKISFESGDHGDGNPFDGRGGPEGIIAHAFAPTNGRFHYDADEPWAVGAVQGAFDLETVALHEIGHLLGLHHSSVEGAIMYPSIAAGVKKGLHGDDIQGIRDLYNV
ncbi:metalloendoproteinase 3-MMP-like [Citrus sinensis]|uniref:metalloendoproteinase 3-MMP-like n=1 Tax=Citrus sinensis TaxID=2711 RepID=UPI002279A337|nr:metalloendoproteinase 3-MMP-like [Citrus sinensis]